MEEMSTIVDFGWKQTIARGAPNSGWVIQKHMGIDHGLFNHAWSLCLMYVESIQRYHRYSLISTSENMMYALAIFIIVSKYLHFKVSFRM